MSDGRLLMDLYALELVLFGSGLFMVFCMAFCGALWLGRNLLRWWQGRVDWVSLQEVHAEHGD